MKVQRSGFVFAAIAAVVMTTGASVSSAKSMIVVDTPAIVAPFTRVHPGHKGCIPKPRILVKCPRKISCPVKLPKLPKLHRQFRKFLFM